MVGKSPDLSDEEFTFVANHLMTLARNECPHCGSSDLKQGDFARPDGGHRTVYCGNCKARLYVGLLPKERHMEQSPPGGAPDPGAPHPPPMANPTDPGAFQVDRDPGDEASPQLLYKCPVCTNEEILYGQVSCQKCDVALVWSGDRIDQPRVHPAEAEEGRPIPVPGVGDAPPRGDSTSEASGVQEAEAPVSALETPGSLPGESKEAHPQAGKNPVAAGPPSLPTPPKGEEKQPPVMDMAGGQAPTIPSLPDEPDPIAPHSGLRCSEIAAVAHSANVAYRQVVGDPPGPSWLQADPETQESVIAGVKAVLTGQINGPAASHKSWYDRKLAEGWEAGEIKSIAAKQHPNMAALGVWGDLPEIEKRKDLLFLSIVVALVRAP